MALITKTISELDNLSTQRIGQQTSFTQNTDNAKSKIIPEITNREIAAAYTAFNSNQLGSFLRNATGEQLDLIGELLSVERFLEQQIEVSAFDRLVKIYTSAGTFGDYDNGADISLPIGTRLSTDESFSGADDRVFFVTTSAITLPADQTEWFIGIRAEVSGTTSNISAGSLKNLIFSDYASYNDGIFLQVTNTEAFIIAQDREGDDNYRFRLSQKTLTSEGGNFEAVKLAALNVPGVADVIIETFKRGTGTAELYIQATTATVPDPVLFEVQRAVNAVAPFGSSIIARKPNNIGVELIFTMTFASKTTESDKTDIKASVRRAVSFLINSLPIGESLNLQTILNTIFSVDSRIKNVGSLNKPFEQVFIYRDTRVQDNKIKELFIGDEITAFSNERIIIEPSILTPISIL